MDTNLNALIDQYKSNLQKGFSIPLRFTLRQQNSKQNEQNSEECLNENPVNRRKRWPNDLLRVEWNQDCGKSSMNSRMRQNLTQELLTRMRTNGKNSRQSDTNMHENTNLNLTTTIITTTTTTTTTATAKKDKKNFYCRCCQYSNDYYSISCNCNQISRDDMDVANNFYKITDFNPLTKKFNCINCQTNDSILNKHNHTYCHQRHRVERDRFTRNAESSQEIFAHTVLPNKLTDSLVHRDSERMGLTSVPVSSSATLSSVPFNSSKLSGQVVSSTTTIITSSSSSSSSILSPSSTVSTSTCYIQNAEQSKCVELNENQTINHNKLSKSSSNTSTSSISPLSSLSSSSTRIIQATEASKITTLSQITISKRRKISSNSHSNKLNNESVTNSTISDDNNKNSCKKFNYNNFNASNVNLRCRQKWKTHLNTIFKTLELSKVLWICVTFVLLFGLSNSFPDSIFPLNNTSYMNKINATDDGVCQSIDVRNKPANLRLISKCRVIEGFLMISLIDKYNETDYDLEFPDLVEITDFLLLYRVNGLKTLSRLFPNLRVIRGNSLIKDYALIIYEMMHLHEIGLKSLTHIQRGGVRIEKNPKLCFVDTIDWTKITMHAEEKDNVIVGNPAPNECPVCPSGKKPDGSPDYDPSDALECPRSKLNPNKRLCWNRQNCQKVCPENCIKNSCSNSGQCCEDKCLTCPSEPSKCETCQKFSLIQGTEKQCMEKCPSNMFSFENRRCVDEGACRQIISPVFLNYEANLPKYPYIPFGEHCALDCPPGYYPELEPGAELPEDRRRFCKKCEGICKKVCSSRFIDSISAAQSYRGCTHISGTVIIQINSKAGHNVVKELETSLADIEVIEGSLKVTRSHPIVSLHFFKKLKVIKGNNLETNRYAFYVMENSNLEQLFDHDVIIEKGKLFFHFNPKLCRSKIEDLKKNVHDLRGLDELPVEDVAINSNGDKTGCDIKTLGANATKISSRGALIEFDAMHYDDERSLLGYTLYSMKAPYRNVSLFDGRDACGNDGWKPDDITDFAPVGKITQLLSHLEPYTQYAFYVKTYTIASESKGGQSDIHYFRTKADQPDQVRSLTAIPKESNKITLQWKPPSRPNGNLTTYIIKCSLIEDDPHLLEQRNYCSEPIGEFKLNQPVVTPPSETKSKDTDQTCDCDDEDREHSKFEDSEAEQFIAFENELHNLIYIKQKDTVGARRRRRDVMIGADRSNITIPRPTNSSTFSSIAEINGQVFPGEKTEKMERVNLEEKNSRKDKSQLYFEYIYKEVNASVQSITLEDLRHFTSYTISIRACREPEPNDERQNCSTEVIAYQRTGKLPDADIIEEVKVDKVPSSNHSAGVVRLSWSPPRKSNGLIVSYNIKYQRVDLENSKAQELCISQNTYKNLSGTYTMKRLENGNYSFSINVNSLAGAGPYSKPSYYLIDESFITVGFVLGVIFLAVLLVLAGAFALWFYRRKYGPPDSGLKLIASVNPEYVSMQYQPDEWEVPREKIIQLKELGQGSFGMVYEGIVNNLDQDHENMRCAIKTVNENATDRERINFLKEAAVMKAFDTHHVVRLLGVVSRGQPTLVLMELMANGDLKGYLRSHRPEVGHDKQPPTLKRILQMAIEIADGMAYLSAKKFVHRDLAARNCMVAEDLTVKIGDFGMTRDIYETDYYRKGTKGLLPVRWMAPESLKDGVFSSSSDVFSFGIVLWEMATLASQPYQGLSNDQVLRYVIDGGVMERPENCPEKLYSLMCRTWQHRPSARPTFMQIVSMLLDDASTSFRNLSFYHSPEGQELLQLPQHQILETVDVRTPLRAEEENFSVEGDEEDEEDTEDHNSFLMQSGVSLAQDGGPSNSPLR